MRTVDLSGGSLKALLLVLLIAANLLAALPNDSARGRSPGSARASRAALGASPSGTQEQGKFSARAQNTAPAPRAFPAEPEP
jgi:hypothetical protein